MEIDSQDPDQRRGMQGGMLRVGQWSGVAILEIMLVEVQSQVRLHDDQELMSHLVSKRLRVECACPQARD